MSFNFDAVKDVLRCPQSRTELVPEDDSLVCVDPNCRLRFEIRDDIPILLVESATQLPDEEWAAVMAGHGRNPATGDDVHD